MIRVIICSILWYAILAPLILIMVIIASIVKWENHFKDLPHLSSPLERLRRSKSWW